MSLIFLPRIVTDGLVLAIDAANTKSYPGSGTTWFDLTQNNYNGSLVSGSTFSSENLGTVTFNGVDQYYSLGVNLDSYSSITANMWIKKPFFFVEARNSYGSYFSYAADQGDLSLGWGIRIPQPSSQATNPSLYEYWAGGGTNVLLYINGVITLSPSTSVNKKNTYNGVNIFDTWQYLTVIAEGVTNFHSQKRLRIARRTEDSNINQQAITKCTVGSFTVYNRVLSSSEILQNYNATRTRFGL